MVLAQSSGTPAGTKQCLEASPTPYRHSSLQPARCSLEACWERLGWGEAFRKPVPEAAPRESGQLPSATQPSAVWAALCTTGVDSMPLDWLQLGRGVAACSLAQGPPPSRCFSSRLPPGLPSSALRGCLLLAPQLLGAPFWASSTHPRGVCVCGGVGEEAHRGLNPRGSDPVGPGRSLGICISSKLPGGGGGAAGWGVGLGQR